jgi:hypothetical protein
LQFSAPGYEVAEGAARAVVTVTRTGDASGAATVEYATVDDNAPVRCDVVSGTAYARCDYATTVDALRFEPGETTKSFTVPLVDDTHVEGNETLRLSLSAPTGAILGSQSTATLTIQDNDGTVTTNPIFTASFFSRMQYLDFLNREPEAGEPWTALLNNCPDVNNNPSCDRITVSGSFFNSPEFRLKGFYVFLFYKVAFNRLPTYAEITPDMRGVTGQTPEEVYAKRAAFANAFVGRQEFRTPYEGLSSAAYVSALLARYGLTTINTPDPANPDTGPLVTLSNTELTNRLQAGTLSRAQVLRAVVQSQEVGEREFNNAFVAMQYYGYLRRSPEPEGYNNWLTYLNTRPGDYRTMINGFVNAVEYRLRFGQP